jgi:hypothetical protein
MPFPSFTSQPRRVRRRTGTLVALAAVGAATTGIAVAIPATGAIAAPDAAPKVGSACPKPFPVSAIKTGMTATGLTVSKGTTPQPFSAKVIGLIQGGIAPGTDLIVVRTDSAAIRAAGGIWAGMSGSPVYAKDGRLLGSVSYSLSQGQSSVAGVTPAAAMFSVLNLPPTTPATTRHIAIPAAMAHELVASRALDSAQATGGFIQSPIAVGASGVGSPWMTDLQKRLTPSGGTAPVMYSASAPKTLPHADPASIKPGGNFISGLATGDVSAYAGGTTTLVCKGKAVAFGHPALGIPGAQFFAQSGSAVYVQNDYLGGSYKILNVTGNAGRVDQDRLFGSRAVLGKIPTSIPIRSTMTDATIGKSRDGATGLAAMQILPDITASHLITNMETVTLGDTAGTALLGYTIQGHTSAGPFTVHFTSRYADPTDYTFGAAFPLFLTIGTLTANPFRPVTVDSVNMTASLNEHYNAYTLQAVQVNQAGTWVAVDPNNPTVTATGASLQARAVLRPFVAGGQLKMVPFTVAVPADGFGVPVTVAGGSYGTSPSPSAATSFADLVTRLNGQLRSDSVWVSTTTDANGTLSTSSQTFPQSLVVNGLFNFTVLPAQ